MSEKVVIGYIHDGQGVAHTFHESLLRLLGHDGDGPGHVIGRTHVRCPSGHLGAARNRVVRAFLGSAGKWLLWLDTDMGFDEDVVDQLLAVADPVTRPVVGGLYFSQRTVAESHLGGVTTLRPVILRWDGEYGGYHRVADYPRDAVTECDAVGAGCTLIHRSIFEALASAHPAPWSGWYTPLPDPADPSDVLPEDTSMCLRMREAGLPRPVVHTGVRLSHQKAIWLTEADYLATRPRMAPHPHPYVPRKPPRRVRGPRLSVIIPFRAAPGSHRARLHECLAPRWRDVAGQSLDIELIYVDDGRRDGESWSLARALNRGVERAAGEYITLYGADQIPPTLDRLQWIRELLNRLPWALVYERHGAYTEDATAAILAGADPVSLAGQATVHDYAPPGNLAVRRDVLLDVGGMDERLEEWGHEDRCLGVALESEYPEGRSVGSGVILQLWHPPAPRGAGTARNRRYLAEYVEAAQGGRMREYLDATRDVRGRLARQ